MFGGDGQVLAYIVPKVLQMYEVGEKYTESGTYLQYPALNTHSFCIVKKSKEI